MGEGTSSPMTSGHVANAGLTMPHAADVLAKAAECP
jgi:hypothetical protein